MEIYEPLSRERFLSMTFIHCCVSVICTEFKVCVVCIICGGERDVTSAEVIAILKKHGWVLIRIKGSHHQFIHSQRRALVTVPHPRKDIKTGTLAQIWRQAGFKP